MSTYYIHRSAGSDLGITGENIVDAIEQNFPRIAAAFSIGNAAGYSLDSVWLDYQDGILGGKGGGVLHILSHGSDGLVGYDPRNDEPKETALWSFGVTRSDIPARHDFTLNHNDEKPRRSPFDDPENLCEAWANITALLDHIGKHYCRVESVEPSIRIGGHYSGLRRTNPARYLELMRQAVSRARPVQNAKSTRALDQVDKLAVYISGYTSAENIKALDDYHYTFYYARAITFLLDDGKTTALAYYRKKAGLSARQLADAVGMSDRQIRNYERVPGSSLGNARDGVVQVLADALHVAPSQLVRGGLAVLVDQNGNAAYPKKQPDPPDQK